MKEKMKGGETTTRNIIYMPSNSNILVIFDPKYARFIEIDLNFNPITLDSEYGWDFLKRRDFKLKMKMKMIY